MIHLKINIHPKFAIEKKYVLTTLFQYFENVQINFIEHDQPETILTLENNSISFASPWWEASNEKDYYSHPQVKERVQTTEISLFEKQFPLVSFYGEPEIEEQENELHFKFDLLATAFHLLSRWEEKRYSPLDSHDRFPDSAHILIRHQLAHRPVVNEYIAIMQHILEKITGQTVNYNRKYSCYFTHDVDEVFRFNKWHSVFRILAGDLFLRKSIGAVKDTLKHYFRSLQDDKKDPSYTFEYLYTLAKTNQCHSAFYFLPGKKGEVDYRYCIDHLKVIEVIQNLAQKDCVIGFHPSYGAYEEQKQFEKELQRLAAISGTATQEGRHHYLRVKMPDTLRIWEANQLKIDSSLGFSENIGFRCGICFPFHPFDYEQRTTLQLLERPLICMEVALRKQAANPDEFEQQLIDLAKVVAHYQGDFVLLWHNNNIHHPYWRRYAERLPNMLKAIAPK